MFKRMLVPVDGSETSTNALLGALRLAGKAGACVRVVHCLDDLAYVPGYDYGADLLRIAREQAETILRDAMELAKAANVAADSRLVEAPGRRLGEVIADEAVTWEADLIVVGTHGRRGAGRVLLGSGAEQVIRMASVPVLTFRGGQQKALAR